MTDNYISVQGRSSKSRSQRDVTCRRIERYKLGMDRLADFKLAIVSENDWQDVERPQITVNRNCHLSSCHCYYYYCCCCFCCCFGELSDNNNNFTVRYFADVSFVRTAVLVFHFQVAPNLNDEAWHILIWFSGTECTVRGIATIQPVVRSSRSRRCFHQSDEVFWGIRPVPNDMFIAVITPNLPWTLQLLWGHFLDSTCSNAKQMLCSYYINWVVMITRVK